jgi:hypothetical protein
MPLFSWLHKRMTSRPASQSTSTRKPSTSFRPRLEVLEGRDVPSTLTVTNKLDSGAGSLRADIAAAKSGDTIVFAPSLVGQTITLTSGELSITTGVTIQGPAADQLTVSGNNQFGVFEVNANQPVVLSGMTITDAMGFAILNHSALMVNGCTISNSVHGINNLRAGTLTMSQSTISGNNAGSGFGGGIACSGTVNLTDCTLANNRAYKGGAVFVYAGATANLTNCTIANNSAILGGGIFVYGVLNLTNTIVAGNHISQGWYPQNGPDIYGAVAKADHNLVGDGRGSSGIFNLGNGNIVGAQNGYPPINPLLGPLQYNGGHTQTMALLAGSPAIGHADNSKAPATDQRGVTRHDEAGEMTDIGAFEL